MLQLFLLCAVGFAVHQCTGMSAKFQIQPASQSPPINSCHLGCGQTYGSGPSFTQLTQDCYDQCQKDCPAVSNDCESGWTACISKNACWIKSSSCYEICMKKYCSSNAADVLKSDVDDYAYIPVFTSDDSPVYLGSELIKFAEILKYRTLFVLPSYNVTEAIRSELLPPGVKRGDMVLYAHARLEANFICSEATGTCDKGVNTFRSFPGMSTPVGLQATVWAWTDDQKSEDTPVILTINDQKTMITYNEQRPLLVDLEGAESMTIQVDGCESCRVILRDSQYCFSEKFEYCPQK